MASKYDELSAEIDRLKGLAEEALARGDQAEAVRLNDLIYSKSFNLHNASREEKKMEIEKRKAEAGAEKKQAREQGKDRKAIADRTRQEAARRRSSQNETVLTTPLGVTKPPTVKKKKVLGV